MIYGVFSDVHSNYEALKAVLEFFRKHKISHYICCGDLVGYGPQPSECVRAIMGMENVSVVLGNHDAATAEKMELRWFNHHALAAIKFTQHKLSASELMYLSDLPEVVKTEDFTTAHGSPRKPLTEYLQTETQFMRNLAYWDVSPCFIGHTHIPAYFRQSDGPSPKTEFLRPIARIPLDGLRCMLNPGSVGQPRDGNPRASCGLYDAQKKTFEIFRVEYDVARTQDLMRDSELPSVLIERLAYGL